MDKMWIVLSFHSSVVACSKIMYKSSSCFMVSAGRTEKDSIVCGGMRPVSEGSDEDGEMGYATAASNRLPMANLVRLMRQVLPTDVKISTRAKDLIHDCAVEFVGFVGSEASECATAQHRRTIAPEDFTRSFQTLGLDDYVGPLSNYIHRYRENQNVVTGACSLATPPGAASASFTNEEVQFLMSVVPEPRDGYYDGATSLSPPPTKYNAGYM
jgi:nuclear transcription Y subunit beta